MSIISQQKYQRQRMVKYARKHSVTETAIRYKVSRKTVYKWLSRYDGTVMSLEDHSHRPKTSPRSHTQKELKQIRHRLKKYHWTDLLLSYQELVEKDGYTRSYGGFKRVAAKLKAAKPKKAKRKRKPKPYQRAAYPGQKIQIDVKYVPSYCVTDGRKYYQYTAVDECSRWTYRDMYDEHSTYSSRDFLEKLMVHAPFPIREVQTDNGAEFTNYYKEVHDKNRVYYEYHSLENSQETPPDYNEISFICLRPDGCLETPSTLSIVCRTTRTKLEGFEGFHFHQLRHTYTSNLLSNGAAPKDVQELLGHSDVSTTMNVYAHATREAKRNSARILDKVAGMD